MKRKFLVLLCAISVIFSGCSIVEEYGRGTLENKEIKKSDEMSPILEDEDDMAETDVDETNEDTGAEVDDSSDVKSKETAKAEVETPKKDETATNESKEDKKSEVQPKKEIEEKKSEDSKSDDKSEVENKKSEDKKADKKSDEKNNENKDTNKAADKNADKKESVDIVSSKNDDPPAEPVKNEEPVKKESGDYSSLSNEKAGWWFNPKKAGGNGKSTIPEKTANLLNKYNGIWQAKTDEKVMYLTFDEGYEYNNNTAKILDTLKAKGVKAAFFVTGAYVKSNLDLVNRMANEGHLVCNHSVNHLNQVEAIKNPKKLEDDIAGLQTLYKEKTGNNLASFLRPPEGVYSERTLKFINDMGYRPVFWSFAYKDWLRDNQPDKKFAIEKITGQFHPGSVLLLHAVSDTNAEILGEIIDQAVNMGYRFGSLYEL
ncbi:MAG: polysaccharide deacetylase family protein [Ezakiella sp.]|uniref:polysaccharide deacetylase family protein n=1 Tax=Ezakiella sp. TaxID=1935205 RepID=UPI0029740190|nr:polysaccharide deacetylase family protein [Ezakiella sp.]MDD7730813.1 polysaccharide deacetylase family protein [Eubacteriales bacterium]MDY6079938.1 polysaccharide deacetylase family protein [Ezakiella sp.]